MTTRRTTVLAPAALALAVALTACAQPATRPPAPAPIAWKLDDLGKDEQGRYFSTCENPLNERQELEVWLTEEQAADHQEGGPCPTDDIRTPEYMQEGDEVDLDRKRPSVAKPPKPAAGTVPGKTGTGTGSTSGKTSGSTGTGSTPSKTPSKTSGSTRSGSSTR